MFKKCDEKIWIITSIALKFLLISMLFFAVFKNDWQWTLFAIIMVGLVFIPDLIRLHLKTSIPFLFDTLISVALLLHMGNGLLDIYIVFPIYNKITHLFSAAVVGFMVLLGLLVFNEKSNENLNLYKLVFDITVIVISLGVLWEFMEWTADLFFSLNAQPSLNDTMSDLFADALGGLFIGLVGFYLVKKGCLNGWIKNFKKIADSLD